MSIRQKLPTLSNRLLLGIALAAAALCAIVIALHGSDQQKTETAEVAPSPQIISPAPMPAPVTEGDVVLDLFNPSEASLSEQLSESTLKRRLEEAMTTSFILKRCGRLNDTDYNNTYRALMTYAQKMQPTLNTAQLLENFNAVIASASASYGLIYARLSCDTPQLTAATEQLAAWRAAILNPPPPQD